MSGYLPNRALLLWTAVLLVFGTVPRAVGRSGGSIVRALIRQLDDADPEVRISAAVALQDFGPAAKSAVPALMKLLKSPRTPRDLQFQAADALVGIGGPAVPALVRILKNRPLDPRLLAVRILGRMGPAASPAIPGLMAALEDPAWELRDRASATLGRIGSAAVPALEKALESPSLEIVEAAVTALGEMGAPAARAIPGLLVALRAKRPSLRWRAAKTLENLGLAAAPAVDGLIELLSDPSPSIRSASAAALGAADGKKRQSVTALQVRLEDSSRMVRLAAARALIRLGSMGPEIHAALIEALQDEDRLSIRAPALAALQELGGRAVPSLVKALRGRDSTLRRSAAEALGELGREAASAIPDVIACLDDGDPVLRALCADILASIEPPAHVVLPALRTRLGGEADPGVQRRLIRALGFLGKQAIPILKEALKNKKSGIRRQIMESLIRAAGDQGEKALIPTFAGLARDGDPAIRRLAIAGLTALHAPSHLLVAILLDATQDPDVSVRQTAGRLLESSGPKAVPLLLKELGKEDSLHGIAAVTALGRIGLHPDLVVPVLAGLLDNKSLRGPAMEALGRFRSGAASAAPRLVELLQPAEGNDLRAAAAETLGQIGPAAAEAIPALLQALGSDFSPLRQAACRSLGAFGPASATAVPALRRLARRSGEGARQEAIHALDTIRQGEMFVEAARNVLQASRQRQAARVHARATIDLQSRWTRAELVERLDYIRATLGNVRRIHWLGQSPLSNGSKKLSGYRVRLAFVYDNATTEGDFSFRRERGDWRLLGFHLPIPQEIEPQPDTAALGPLTLTMLELYNEKNYRLIYESLAAEQKRRQPVEQFHRGLKLFRKKHGKTSRRSIITVKTEENGAASVEALLLLKKKTPGKARLRYRWSLGRWRLWSFKIEAAS